MKILEKILKSVLTETEIIYKKQLSKSAFHIRIQSDEFSKMNIIPGAFLRVGIGIGKDELSMKDKIRSYSIWNVDLKNGVIDIAVATHSNGIGSYWVSNCKVGDKLFCKLKTGKFLMDEMSDSYLMIGDLSALSHLYMIQRELGPNKYIKGIIYSENQDDFFPDVDNKTPFDFYKKPQNPINEVLDEIKKSLPLMKGRRMVYIAGDSRLCVALTQFFRKELKWEVSQIKAKPFWNPEKKGLE
ncbi:SIP domain-containing protein [Flammeovirga kamogawensis]|uniref:SIP domain-containing protein n=1 Tax=Flammeovirga kamogawensis TaxID=373891 RepID=A0ABX8GQK3_9BACT|nr:SIP domain-containing protein [Flammeovirga kamogawensis]MBB6462111.1 NADPH-dependent ferric siderophore reductase [Flammeovirga kamogawensis]QWG05845.1 SIP domain-containing protein [Flammeovirga kamogawensis]TRX67670.1 siderophore-interacting protein [Flammeovirga kamogawensis]